MKGIDLLSSFGPKLCFSLTLSQIRLVELSKGTYLFVFDYFGFLIKILVLSIEIFQVIFLRNPDWILFLRVRAELFERIHNSTDSLLDFTESLDRELHIDVALHP